MVRHSPAVPQNPQAQMAAFAAADLAQRQRAAALAQRHVEAEVRRKLAIDMQGVDNVRNRVTPGNPWNFSRRFFTTRKSWLSVRRGELLLKRDLGRETRSYRQTWVFTKASRDVLEELIRRADKWWKGHATEAVAFEAMKKLPGAIPVAIEEQYKKGGRDYKEGGKWAIFDHMVVKVMDRALKLAKSHKEEKGKACRIKMIQGIWSHDGVVGWQYYNVTPCFVHKAIRMTTLARTLWDK